MSDGRSEPDSRPRVAVLCGSDVERSIVWDSGLQVDGRGNNDSWRLIAALGPDELAWSRIHITPGYFRQQRRWEWRKFDVVWNMITDPDQNPATLEVAARLLADVKLPVVNRPQQMALTRRDRMAERLQGLPGVVTPKVLLLRNPSLDRVRRAVDNAGFRFPAIVRRTGTQSGRIIGLFDRLEDLPLFGDRRHEYFMTEFHDLRFRDGHFRKSRYMFVGDAIVPRQHIVSDGWNIHGADFPRVTAANEQFQRESDELLIGGAKALQPTVRVRLAAIRARIPLDYCGIDCCVTEDDRLVVFEVNATMNVWPMHGRMEEANRRVLAEAAIAAVHRLILAKTGQPDPETASALQPTAAI